MHKMPFNLRFPFNKQFKSSWEKLYRISHRLPQIHQSFKSAWSFEEVACGRNFSRSRMELSVLSWNFIIDVGLCLHNWCLIKATLYVASYEIPANWTGEKFIVFVVLFVRKFTRKYGVWTVIMEEVYHFSWESWLLSLGFNCHRTKRGWNYSKLLKEIINAYWLKLYRKFYDDSNNKISFQNFKLGHKI